ncbi:MAG: Vms1/Ankzf1 family peptidyl-tRNA hydrolase [Halobacteriota archaeon]
MLDELLGRATLKARIEELTEENRHLERRAEAEEERRAEAVSARQEAEERVNRLEDRIAELTDRVERLSGDDPDVDFRGSETLRGGRLDDVLARLRSFETGAEGALTAVVEESLPEPVSEAFGDRAPLVRRAAPCLALTDDAGLVSVVLDPPRRPSPFASWGTGFRLDESWFRPTGTFAFALVRADVFAYGEYDGRERTAVETKTSAVKNAHSKGGFSQARFERRRDEQIAAHLEACRGVIDERKPDRLYVVGERTVLGEFRDVADHVAVSDATGDPEVALDDAFRSFWTTRLFLL